MAQTNDKWRSTTAIHMHRCACESAHSESEMVHPFPKREQHKSKEYLAGGGRTSVDWCKPDTRARKIRRAGAWLCGYPKRILSVRSIVQSARLCASTENSYASTRMLLTAEESCTKLCGGIDPWCQRAQVHLHVLRGVLAVEVQRRHRAR
eukprot:2189827-Pleurochrysis_carterae.AAC.2